MKQDFETTFLLSYDLIAFLNILCKQTCAKELWPQKPFFQCAFHVPHSQLLKIEVMNILEYHCKGRKEIYHELAVWWSKRTTSLLRPVSSFLHEKKVRLGRVCSNDVLFIVCLTIAISFLTPPP